MSEDREKALEMAISALLGAAKEQGVHIAALCEGAASLVRRHCDHHYRAEIAVTTIHRLAYRLSRSG